MKDFKQKEEILSIYEQCLKDQEKRFEELRSFYFYRTQQRLENEEIERVIELSKSLEAAFVDLKIKNIELISLELSLNFYQRLFLKKRIHNILIQHHQLYEKSVEVSEAVKIRILQQLFTTLLSNSREPN